MGDDAVRRLLREACDVRGIRAWRLLHSIAFSYCCRVLYGESRPGPKIKTALGLDSDRNPAKRNIGSGIVLPWHAKRGRKPGSSSRIEAK